MNIYDSSQIAKNLKSSGYELSESPESIDNADLILLNTCSIRAKACQKAFSFLGRLPNLKKKNSNLIIGVCGCMAQQDGYKIIERMPHVDFVSGTNAINRLPDIAAAVEKNRNKIVDIDLDEPIGERVCSECDFSDAKISEFVTIMRGCDNFCTYCVVPYVRGREISRKPEDIINEIKKLVSNGAKEITLLGQNVNSYGKKEGLCSFAELLALINQIEGLERIRFTTSHPKDLADDLIESFKRLDKLCHHIHLPVQSGSDSVLKRMNRKYTRDDYLEKIQKLRDINPDIAITSDFIVGFCGETDEDFNLTLDLIRKIEFDGIFAFIYSTRPNTPALKFKDNLLELEKNERLQRLLELQEHYTRKKNETLVGTKQSVLVEGISKMALAHNQKREWSGRTGANKIINFAINQNKIEDKLEGRILNIKVEKAFSHSLWGTF